MLTIMYAREDKELPPFKAPTDGDAGYDLYARENAWIFPWSVKKIPANLCLEIPVGWNGVVRGRSGNTIKGIIVYQGTIDVSYRGEIHIMTSSKFLPKRIRRGDRIAQMVFEPCATDNDMIEILKSDLSKTNRNTNGFGSSGMR